MTVVHAPAGYGKTTLLTQYFDYLSSSGEHCGWLTLDGSDDDPVQLLAYLIASLKTVPAVSDDIMDAALNGLHGFHETAATNLIFNLLSGLRKPVTIFLDDYHVLPPDNTGQLIQKLIELTSDKTRFVVASREIPVNLKGRLQLSGSYFELAVGDLALTQQETSELIGSSSRLNVAEKNIELLHRKTEGWVAAIEFAKLWLESNPDLDISEFINQSTDFTTFLITEIFRCLPEETQDTMLKTSIVKEFNGDLINALCKRNDGWQVLDDLIQRDLVIPLDETQNRFRYHHLLTEFLLDRSQKIGGTDLKSLQGVAAEWHLDQGNPTEALRHALADNDQGLIASTLERLGGWHLILDGRISTFAFAIQQLSVETLRNFPSTYLGYLLLLGKSGNIAAASARFEAYRRETNNFMILHGKPLPQSFAINANVFDFFLNAFEDRPQTPQYIARLELVLKGIAKSDHFHQAILQNFLTYAYFDSSRYDKAYSSGEAAIYHYKELRSIYGESYMYFHLGKICLAQGRLRDARQLYDQGYLVALENFGVDSDITAIAAAHLAEVAYEVNDVGEARKYLEIALPRIEQSEAWFDVYISAYLTAAKIAHDLEGPKNSKRVLLRAARTGKRRNIGRLRLFSLCQYTRILIGEKKLQKAGWIIDRLQFKTTISDRGHKKFLSHRLKYEAGSSRACYLVACGEFDEVFDILDPLIAEAKRHGSRRNQISLSLLLALTYLRLKKLKPALSRLNDAVSLAIFEECKRPFLEQGSDVLELFEAAIAHTEWFPMNRMKRTFILDLKRLINRNNKSRGDRTAGSLTPRQREIVKYIREGCSNKEIARNCNCTENTVKYHLKNVFSKLKVKNRKELAHRSWSADL